MLVLVPQEANVKTRLNWIKCIEEIVVIENSKGAKQEPLEVNMTPSEGERKKEGIEGWKKGGREGGSILDWFRSKF